MVQERPALLKIKNRRRFGLAASNSGGSACPSPNACCASSILASLVKLEKAFRLVTSLGVPEMSCYQRDFRSGRAWGLAH
jgi:hypothetical protein